MTGVTRRLDIPNCFLYAVHSCLYDCLCACVDALVTYEWRLCLSRGCDVVMCTVLREGAQCGWGVCAMGGWVLSMPCLFPLVVVAFLPQGVYSLGICGGVVALCCMCGDRESRSLCEVRTSDCGLFGP